MTVVGEIQAIAKSVSSRLIEIRRDLHRHPELGLEERRTCHIITEHLRALDLDEVRSPVAKTGVVGLLKGGKRNKGTRVVALRADMDALPIEEANRVPYRSLEQGKMHACGHDGHVAMVIGAAMILKRLRARLPGAVKFLFQPGEEGFGGAALMIRDGALDRPKVDAIFGMHMGANMEYGAAGISAGPIMAAADRFTIRVTGRGGHGAHPELCADPLLAANRLYQEIQGIERSLGGFDRRVISICSMHGGTAFNIIPDTVELLGTVRTMETRVQDVIIARMRRAVRGVAIAHGVKCRLHYRKDYAVTHNDPALADLARRAAVDLGIPVRDFVLTMGAEDFSLYQQKIPGLFMDMGIRKRPDQPSFHNSRFDFDDRVLALGAALMARCAMRYLEGSAAR